MHNKFVERKRKSIINPLSISDHKKLESIHEQSKTNVQHFRAILISIVKQEQSRYICQQHLLNNWNPVLPSTFHSALISKLNLQYKSLQQQQIFSK